MSTAKQEVESLLKTLPEDCTLEDVQYHLYVIEKIQVGSNGQTPKGSLIKPLLKRNWASEQTRSAGRSDTGMVYLPA